MSLKRIVLALALAALAYVPAAVLAADLTVKATPFLAPAPCNLAKCSGWYVGGGLSGNGSSGQVTSGGLPVDVFASGTILDAHAGYQIWNGSALFAVEAGIGNQFSNGPISGQFGATTFMSYEGIKLGGTLAGLVGGSSTTDTTTPGQASGPLSVFSSLENQMISPYVWLGAVQRGGYNQGTIGAGVEYVAAKNWNLDVRYVYAPALNELSAMNQLTLGLNYHFSVK